MSIYLYSHPFASYCQKVLIALYENDTRFELKMLDGATPENFAELTRLWPLKKFPVLVDDGQVVIETSVIIEYLALNHPGPVELIPSDPKRALEIRFMDRFFDNYIMTPMQTPVSEALRAEGGRKEQSLVESSQQLETAYAWLERRLGDRIWAAGASFSMADCAAAPSLFYADWVHQISPAFPLLRDYRARLLARPSVARSVDEARPFRSLFPLGAPNRD
jgi:glutathione S-transferase